MTPEAPGQSHESVVWVRRETSAVIMGLGAVFLVAQARRTDRSQARRVFDACALIGVLVCSSTIRVVVNNRGFEVGFGPWGWPKRHIPLERIAAARVETLSPLYWGFGLGYRVVPGHSRVILRPGPGVVIEMTDGHTFGVTVRDASRAVELINAAVKARS